MNRMCRHKKITALVCVFLTALNIVACGQVKEDEIVNIEDLAVNLQENSAQTVELLDSFINGSINAVDSTALTSTFYITDLKMDSEEWDSNSESGMNYILNGTEISYEEYAESGSKTFAAQVDTNSNKINNDGQTKKDDVLEDLIGQYEYLSDYGTGKLTIKKTSCGYDIFDYESESSYRFLADSSNIETIENNRIYIKYPEQIYSDDTVIFSYYILEYNTDEINVYHEKSLLDEAQFLYHAVKKTEEFPDSER